MSSAEQLMVVAGEASADGWAGPVVSELGGHAFGLGGSRLAAAGCELLAVGRHERKLSILDRQGVQVCLEKDLPGELRAGLEVDCTGNPGGLALARRLVRPRGKLVLKSTLHEDQESGGRISLTSLVVDEVTLIGSRCGPFAAALRLLGQGGLVDVDSLVEATWPLEEGIAAFEQAGARGALKVLVKP